MAAFFFARGGGVLDRGLVAAGCILNQLRAAINQSTTTGLKCMNAALMMLKSRVRRLSGKN
jgi:hypothetical protein